MHELMLYKSGSNISTHVAICVISYTECELTEKSCRASSGWTAQGVCVMGRKCPLLTGGWVWGGAVPLPRDSFFELRSKRCRLSCIHIAKNYVWPESWNGGGGLIDSPPGAQDVKRMGVKI